MPNHKAKRSRVYWLTGSAARGPQAIALWQRLFDQDVNVSPMASPTWWRLIHDTFGLTEEPRLLVIESDGEPVAVWPLSTRVTTGRFLRTRILTGANGYHSFYNEPVISINAPQDIHRQLHAALLHADGIDQIRLNRLRQPALAGPGESPRITTSADLKLSLSETPLYHQGSSRRELHRLRRRLSDLGEVTVHHVPGEALHELAPRFTALHTALKRMQQQWAVFRDDRGSSARFGSALETAAKSMGLRAVSIALDDTPRAITIYAFRGRESFAWRAAWDPELKSYGLGAQLFDEAIHWARVQGESVLHLGPGNEPYKVKWASHDARIFNLRTTRPTLSGWVTSLSQRLRRDS